MKSTRESVIETEPANPLLEDDAPARAVSTARDAAVASLLVLVFDRMDDPLSTTESSELVALVAGSSALDCDRLCLVGNLASMSTNDVLAQVLNANAAMHDVRNAMTQANNAAWKATDPRTLELARLLVALLLHCDAEHQARTPGVDVSESVVAELPRWPTSKAFADGERAALAFTEQFVTDVASLGDDTAEVLRLHVGDEGLNNFTRALLVIEQRIRLRLVWDQLLGTVK